MKTHRSCWYFSSGYNTASPGVEEWRGLRRVMKSGEQDRFIPQKLAQAFWGEGVWSRFLTLTPSLLISGTRNQSQSQGFSAVHPGTLSPAQSRGFHTAQREQSNVLRGWESVNIWSSWTKSMELCQFQPSAEPGSFLKHLFSPFPPKKYTEFDFLFPRSTRFPVYPLLNFTQGSSNVSSCPSPEHISVVLGHRNWVIVAFPSRWKVQVNPGTVRILTSLLQMKQHQIMSPLLLTAPHQSQPCSCPGNPLLSNHPSVIQSRPEPPKKLQRDHSSFSRGVASVCELSCWWALMLFFSLKVSFRQLQALTERPPWNILSSKREKIHTLPCWAPFSEAGHSTMSFILSFLSPAWCTS